MTGGGFIDRERLPYPFCPGCSHGPVLDRLGEALQALALDPARVAIVTDIGCSGLSDQWFKTHAFHGLHGRSVCYAQGLKLADPGLHVVVIMGDGGAGIGGHHLLNAAKRNIGVTVVLCNNFNFGMTGGEHSVATPEGAVTATTAGGHFERPLKLAETLGLNGAPFVARRAFYDADLAEVLARAVAFPGFAYVEVLELCTAYYAPWNRLRKAELEALLRPGRLPRLLEVEEGRTEYTAAYRAHQERRRNEPAPARRLLERRHANFLDRTLDVVVSGSAGMKIRSTASLFARAAILSGLHAVQSDDYPVTVQTGHSISFLKLSPEPIGYMGLAAPDHLFVVSPPGYAKALPWLGRMGADRTAYLLGDLPAPPTAARVLRIDPGGPGGRVPREFVSLVALAAFLKAGGPFPVAALAEAAGLIGNAAIRAESLAWIERADPGMLRGLP